MVSSTGFSLSIIGFYDYIQVLSLTSAGIAVDIWWNLTWYPTEHPAVMSKGNWSRSFSSLAFSGVGIAFAATSRDEQRDVIENWTIVRDEYDAK